ncbi:PREDICTED: serine/threonine-protein kinase MARK2-like [Hipposideros armiger]|uniref:non-specific serine/threonine protein kinase n=1 Tax=Hipposideros armiger TaxID=186990 RepID=A0A8B7QUR1_HIPAR|nr:PREDICTED: serine/threonine-protein kinase MARK2-like [Hipposideros armiger]
MEYFFHEIDVDQNSGIDSYELRETTGQGPFTSVVLGHHLLTRCQVAIKIIHERDYITVHRNIKRELRCRKHLHHHPNIIQLYHVICSPDSLFLVMELAPNGSIQDYLCAHGRMPEALARKLFRQLVSALHYCHTKGIAHRNLEPQNVLLDWRMNAKVVDFGFAASFKEHELSMFCGNPLAAPPELFLEQIYHGPAMDMWGLGVLLYKMLTDTYPFTGKNLDEIKHKVLKGEYIVPTYFSSGVTILLKKLIHLNPEGRESLQTILPDPWLNEGYEEELEPYIEPCRDVIDPWVARKMLQLDFPWQDIKDTLRNKNNNYLMATYYILTTKKDELQATPVKGFRLVSPKFNPRIRRIVPDSSPESMTSTLEPSINSHTQDSLYLPGDFPSPRQGFRRQGSSLWTMRQGRSPKSLPDHQPNLSPALVLDSAIKSEVVVLDHHSRAQHLLKDHHSRTSQESWTTTTEPAQNSGLTLSGQPRIQDHHIQDQLHLEVHGLQAQPVLQGCYSLAPPELQDHHSQARLKLQGQYSRAQTMLQGCHSQAQPRIQDSHI